MYIPVNRFSIQEYIQGMLNAASIVVPDPSNDERFIREREVLAMTGLTKSPLSDQFPRHFQRGWIYSAHGRM